MKKKKDIFFFSDVGLFSQQMQNKLRAQKTAVCAKRPCFCHCLHADWDRDQPSLPFKSHKTINLTSTDHPILLGSADANSVSSSLDFTSRSPKEALPTPAHQLIVSDPKSLRVLIKYHPLSQALGQVPLEQVAQCAVPPRRTWPLTGLTEAGARSRQP